MKTAMSDVVVFRRLSDKMLARRSVPPGAKGDTSGVMHGVADPESGDGTGEQSSLALAIDRPLRPEFVEAREGGFGGFVEGSIVGPHLRVEAVVQAHWVCVESIGGQNRDPRAVMSAWFASW